MEQRVLHVGRVPQVNSPRSNTNSASTNSVRGLSPGVTAPAGNVSAVQYQIVTPTELAAQSGCHVPVFLKTPNSNPPPPQLIATSNTGKNTGFIMDNSKQSLKPIQMVQPLQPVQAVVLTASTANTSSPSIQSPQVFATHNGQVVPVIPASAATAIINTSVPVTVPVTVTSVTPNPNVVKLEKKVQKQSGSPQQIRQRKVFLPRPVQASKQQHHNHPQNIQQPPLPAVKLTIVDKGSGGLQPPRQQQQSPLPQQQQQQSPQRQQQRDSPVVGRSTSPALTSPNTCNSLAVTKSTKPYSYSKMRKKENEEQISSGTSVLNKDQLLQQLPAALEQQIQPRRPEITISSIPRLVSISNEPTSTTNSSTAVAIEEMKNKEAIESRLQQQSPQQQQQPPQPQPQQKVVSFSAISGVSTANCQQLLILMSNSGEQWVQLSGNAIPNNDLTSILKKSGVPDTQIEDCKSAILESRCETNNSNVTNNNNNNNNSSTTAVAVPTTTTVPNNVVDGEEQPKNDQTEVPVYQGGKCAICLHCGFSSPTFNQCYRCKRKFPPDVKSITIKNSLDKSAVVAHHQITARSLIRKCSTDSSGNGSSPECPKKKAKLQQERKRSKMKIEEPVCLTISSDEESNDQENLSSRSGASKSDDVSDSTSIPPNASVRLQPQNMEDHFQSVSDYCEEIVCRTVRIGSYKVVPSDKIVFNPFNICISVPSTSENDEIVVIKIPYRQVIKVLAHYGRGMPVFFIYTTPLMGAKIRSMLNMTSKDGYYYDPSSKVETHRRITLLPERLNDDAKSKIKSILDLTSKNIHTEVNSKEANDILVRASPKEVQNILKKTGIPATPPIQTIMVYPPPPMKGGIPINTEDYACLGEDQFLNDVIIDFYLKYLTQTMLNEEERARTHVLSSFFYKRLTTKATGTRRSHNPTEADPEATPAEKRHSRVKSWTKAVNLFTKDFIVIPINENSHWFLAIICFPGLTGPVRFSDCSPITLPAPKPRRKHSALVEGCTDKELANNVMAGKTSLMIGSTTITAVNTSLGVSATPINTTITLEPEEEDRDEADGEDEDWEEESSEDDQESSDNNAKLNDSQRIPLMKDSIEEDENESNRKRIQPEETIKQVSGLTSLTTSTPLSLPTSGKTAVREPIKQPCILIFDSLAGASRAKVVATLRDYLRIEYRVKHGHDRDFSKDVMKGASPKVPQQTNYTDCGLYVLQYVEAFFQDPITDYHVPIKMLQNWFTADIVSRKRYDIQQLLHRLMDEQNVDIVSLNLPDLNLRPNPGLVDYPDTDPEDMEEECEDEEDEDEHLRRRYLEECEEEGEEEEGEEEEDEEGMEDEEEEGEYGHYEDMYNECMGEDEENMEGVCCGNEMESGECELRSIHKGEYKELLEEPMPKVNLKSYRIPRLIRDDKKLSNRQDLDNEKTLPPNE